MTPNRWQVEHSLYATENMFRPTFENSRPVKIVGGRTKMHEILYDIQDRHVPISTIETSVPNKEAASQISRKTTQTRLHKTIGFRRRIERLTTFLIPTAAFERIITNPTVRNRRLYRPAALFKARIRSFCTYRLYAHVPL